MKLPIMPSHWTIDPNHSRIGFYVKHLGISKVNGNFTKFTASGDTSKEDLSDLTLTFEAETASVNTGVSDRDAHLCSPDFFDAEKHPLITFESTSVRPVGENFAKMYGYITILGVKKLIELDVIFYGTAENHGKTSVGLEIVGALKRSDFGFGPKFPENVLSDTVQLRINAEFFLESPN